jgi:hypothetical protein
MADLNLGVCGCVEAAADRAAGGASASDSAHSQDIEVIFNMNSAIPWFLKLLDTAAARDRPPYKANRRRSIQPNPARLPGTDA